MLLVVIASMVLSFALARIDLFSGISEGMRTIILTVVLSAAAAVIAPIREVSKDAD